MLRDFIRSRLWAHAGFWGALCYSGYLLSQQDYAGAFALIAAAFHGTTSSPILGAQGDAK